MPAFSFEKIAPPVRRGSIPATSNSSVSNSSVPNPSSSNPYSPVPSVNAAASVKNSATRNSKKQRGVIVQIIDRFVETRARRTLRGKGA
jgi:hypothetical protein